MGTNTLTKTVRGSFCFKPVVPNSLWLAAHWIEIEFRCGPLNFSETKYEKYKYLILNKMMHVYLEDDFCERIDLKSSGIHGSISLSATLMSLLQDKRLRCLFVCFLKSFFAHVCCRKHNKIAYCFVAKFWVCQRVFAPKFLNTDSWVKTFFAVLINFDLQEIVEWHLIKWTGFRWKSTQTSENQLWARGPATRFSRTPSGPHTTSWEPLL